MRFEENIVSKKEIDRSEIANLIQEVKFSDEIEKGHIEDTVNWINSNAEIFRIEKPAVPAKHLVCYNVLCDIDKQRILLLEHKQSGLVLPSGGHVEKGEMPFETVKRELQEELGIEKANFVLEKWEIPFFVTQVKTVGQTAGHVDVDLWYLLKECSEKPINTDGVDFDREFGKFNWYTFEEILKMSLNTLDPNMHRFIEKARKYFNL